MLLRANAGRPNVWGAPRVSARQATLRKPPRGSSNSHLHLAVVLALATSSLIAIAIPITRTQANEHGEVQSLPSVTTSLSEALRAQAAGFSAVLASSPTGAGGTDAGLLRPPLGSGLFPEPLMAAAAKLATAGVFPTLETQAALGVTRPYAVSFTVHEDGFAATYKSTDLTVGQALASQGVRVDEGDFVSPAPDSELSAGAHIYISHSIAVKLVLAGSEREVKTRAGTVGDVLAQAGVSLEGRDRVTPTVHKPLKAGMVIRVTLVRDITEVIEETIAYSSVVQYDAQLPRGERVVSQAGTDGSVRREYRITRTNDRETRRVLVSETVTPPSDEVITVGTYVRPAAPVAAGAVSPPAPPESLNCSRTLYVYATWYTAASAGGIGITATGTGVYKGIIAVDPRVIPLGTRMYVPGYGYGIAADTGGGIIGNHIDLGYGEDDVKDWRTRWVDICIL